MEVGALSQCVVAALRNDHQIEVASVIITVHRGAVSHLQRERKASRGAALTEPDIDRLPIVLAAPERVLLDTGTTRPSLLYVFDPIGTSRERGKIAVWLDFRDTLAIGEDRPATLITNSVRTAGYVSSSNLNDPRYVHIGGCAE